MMTWKVGDVVRVHEACLNNPPGSIAIVVEVYDRQQLRIGDGLGITLLFSNGAHDGFSAEDQLTFGVEMIGHRVTLRPYRFESCGRLFNDWKAGLFDEVWRRHWV